MRTQRTNQVRAAKWQIACATIALHSSCDHATSAATTEPTLQPSPPAVELRQEGVPTAKYGPNIYRDVYCDTSSKTISFSWRATQELPSGTNTLSVASEEFATEYWPTYAVPLDRYHLCVAGKGPTGDAILEWWTFADHTENGVEAPSLALSNYKWTLPPRVKVDLVLREGMNSPRGMIRGVFPSLRSSRDVYVYFDASRELVMLDLNSHAPTTVASPTGASALAVPALTNDYQTLWAEEYAQRGYCYFFARSQERFGPDPTPPVLAIIDSNRDGAIDTSLLISGDEWSTDGWSDSANIVASAHRF